MRKAFLLLPFLVIVVLLLPDERRETVRPPHEGPAPVAPRKGYPHEETVTAPAATAAPARPAPAPAAAAPPRVAVSDAVLREVEPVARELHANDETRDRIAELTQRSFDELMAEVEGRVLQGSNESQDEIVARKQSELHERILEILTPSQQARYRELIGLR